MKAVGEPEGQGGEALCWQWVAQHESASVARMEGVVGQGVLPGAFSSMTMWALNATAHG